MTVVYDTRPEDYVTLYRVAMARRHPRYLGVTWALLAAAALFMVTSLVLASTSAFVAAAAAALFLVLRLRTPDRLARQRWRRHGSVRYEARFDPTGYTGISAGRTTALEWRAVEVIDLQPQHLHLGGAEVDAVIALRHLPPGWTPQGLHQACLGWRAAAVQQPAPGR